jgi:hypothetical protein
MQWRPVFLSKKTRKFVGVTPLVARGPSLLPERRSSCQMSRCFGLELFMNSWKPHECYVVKAQKVDSLFALLYL